MDKKKRDELDAYYTPKGIAVEMALRLNPKVGSRILDPMCGDGMLLKTLREVYPNRELKFVGFDVDREALYKCLEWKTREDLFEEKSIFSWQDGETFNCDLIIMNPCFHLPERMQAMRCALRHFNKGIMYIPFTVDNPMVDVYSSFKKFELHEYPQDYLKAQFECDIKYRQGTVYWEKTSWSL